MRAFAVVLLSGLSLCGAALAQDSAPEENRTIPPLYRAARHFDEGTGYLRALRDGTRIRVNRADDASFTLALENGKLKTTLPAAQVSADRKVWTSPFGYRMFVRKEPVGLSIESPRGNWTVFLLQHGKYLFVLTKSGSTWSRELGDQFVLRLPDGSRIDTTDQGKTWEAEALGGERARYDVAQDTWTALDPLPSPPLIPDIRSLYVVGNGDTWRMPAKEDHVVFAWNWYPVGLPLAQALEDVRTGDRRRDLDGYFNELPQPQEPAEMAGVVLGRRLSLTGGDRITFEVPGEEPRTVFLLPSPAEPDYFQVRDEVRRQRPTTKSAGN